MNDLISVVIPVYNVEKYLKRCIDSVIRQTYTKIEIILIDDGSFDSSSIICDDFSKEDNRIIVVHKKNGGLSDARNCGIEIAKGKYITFIDSDDYVEDDYIQFLYSTIIKNNADMSICSYQAVYENGKILKQIENYKKTLTPHDTIFEMLYQKKFNVSAWAKMYKTELFNDIRYPKGHIFEDAYTTYKLVCKSSSIVVNMKIKYNYMIRKNSILTSNFNLKKLELIDAYRKMGNDILKIYPDLEWAVMRAIIYANISTLRQMFLAKPRLIKKENEICSYIKKNRKYILKNKNCSKRDKVAVLLIILNKNIFKICWSLYCKFTGRNL